jgi:hypothetical protein
MGYVVAQQMVRSVSDVARYNVFQSHSECVGTLGTSPGPNSGLSVRQHWLWSRCRKILTIHATVATSVTPSPSLPPSIKKLTQKKSLKLGMLQPVIQLSEEQLEFEAVSPDMHQVTVKY